MTASNLATVNPTMSSLELVDVINEVRKANGKSKLRHDNLIKKIESHPGITSPKFLGHASCLMASGATRAEKLYNLPRRECDLLVMSESLAIQAQVYDRLVKELGEKSSEALTNAEIKRIERDYAENLKHHPNYELGEALKRAIRMEDYDNVAELEGILDKLDFAPAARAQGVSVESVRRQVAAHTAATLMLQSMRRGEEPHDSPVTGVVQWARASVKAEDTKAKMIAYQKARQRLPQTLEQIVSHELAHKHTP